MGFACSIQCVESRRPIWKQFFVDSKKGRFARDRGGSQGCSTRILSPHVLWIKFGIMVAQHALHPCRPEP